MNLTSCCKEDGIAYYCQWTKRNQVDGLFYNTHNHRGDKSSMVGMNIIMAHMNYIIQMINKCYPLNLMRKRQELLWRVVDWTLWPTGLSGFLAMHDKS